MRFRPVYLAFLLWACVSISAAQAQQKDSAQPATAPDSKSASSSSGLNSLQGVPVAELRVNTGAAEHRNWLETLITQKAHEPLDKYKVRESVQKLYDTGLFTDIQVNADRNSQGEVVLTFDTQENSFISSALVVGAPDPPGSNRLVNASKLNLGEQFTEEKTAAAIQSMQRTLQENGYYQAKIDPILVRDEANQLIKVTFAISKGIRARVGAIKVSGTPGYTTGEIVMATGLEPGDHVNAADVTRALQRLHKKYQKHGWIEAQTTVTQRTYHSESNTLDYTFDIVRGPIVRVTVEGAGLRQGIIKKYVPIYEENAVDDDLLNEGSRNLRDYFQTKGYFDAKVTYMQKQVGADQVQVKFTVDKGPLHKVEQIIVDGNKYFSREIIRERMQIQKAGGLLLHGIYSQSMVAKDVSSIEGLYRSNGFLQVKVTSDIKDIDRHNKGYITVIIRVAEGPQTLVGKLTIEGNKTVSQDDLRALISSTDGQPYSDVNIASDQTEITNYYFNHGFPAVQFESSAKADPANPQRIDLTYKITEGDPVLVNNVLISGLNYTRGFVAQREISSRSGDALSQEQMLESQQRLYDLGIFNGVEVAVQNPQGDAPSKNVLFQLDEARRYTFTYGVGFEVQTGQPSGVSNPAGGTGASARVSFDVTRLNFRGRDQTLTLQTRYGNLQKRILIGYESPRWFDAKNLTFSLTAFYDDTFDVRTFEARRLEGSADIKQRLNKATTLFYRLIYRRVSIPADTLVIDPNLIPLFSQPVRVGLPDFTYIRDTRDDPTDSHKGAFSTLDTSVASGIFGSEANFGRLLLQNSTYYQFHKKRWVFARSTRIGVERPYGSTNFIPLPERFFAGGSNSHRGFGLNQAGPRDLQTGFPLGGESLFLNNLELRTPPLPLPFVGNDVSAVVFHDMGNVFSATGDIVHSFFQYAQPNRSSCENTVTPSCNFNYMSHAIGTGIRYRTPIGPVSFDLGYNLNPPLFPIAQQNRFDTLGHFNFFFSIGQTF